MIPANFNNAGRELWFYEEQGLVNGIKDEEQSSVVNVYPNPTADIVTIDLSKENAINADMSVQLLDINGRVVSESKLSEAKAQISTANMANGSYIVTVRKGDEMIARRKLAVAH